jgi:hypothetical protein
MSTTITITNSGQTVTANPPAVMDGSQTVLHKVIDVYFAKKTVTRNRQTSTIAFTRIDSAHTQQDATNNVLPYDSILGKTIYVIIETTNMRTLQIDATIKPINNTMTGNTNNLSLMRFNYPDNGTQTYDATNLFTATVGNFDALKNREGSYAHYTNLETTHADKAIIKLQIRPQTRATFNTWARNIAANTVTIEVDVKRTDNLPCAYGATATEEVTGVHNFLNTDAAGRFRIVNRNYYLIHHEDNLYNTFMQGTDRIRIGKIANTHSAQVIYFYIDQNDNEYFVCEATKFSVLGKVNGANVPNNFTQAIHYHTTGRPIPRNLNLPAIVSTIDYSQYQSEGVDARTSYVFATGVVTVGHPGSTYVPRYYANQVDNIEMIPTVFLAEVTLDSNTDIQPALNRVCGDRRIMYGFQATRRRSANTDLFAAFLGALAQCSYQDIVLEGFSFPDGTCFPSVSHANGKAVDSNFLTTLVRQNVFVNALWDYGIRSHGRGRSGWLAQIVHSHYLAGHETHLHSGGGVFDQNFIHELYE